MNDQLAATKMKMTMRQVIDWSISCFPYLASHTLVRTAGPPFLASLTESNTRALYQYLPEAQGRVRRDHLPADYIPLTVGGATLVRNSERSDAIGAEELSAPGAGACYLLPPFRERMIGIPSPVTQKEISIAMEHVALINSPGPDTLSTSLLTKEQIV